MAMKKIFEASLKVGFLELYEADGSLIFLNAYRKGATGVNTEISPEEAADLAEAILRHLGPETALSVSESVLGGDTREKSLAGARTAEEKEKEAEHN